jgi:hypothetical protein
LVVDCHILVARSISDSPWALPWSSGQTTSFPILAPIQGTIYKPDVQMQRGLVSLFALVSSLPMSPPEH